jgi:hypothetical protein
MKFQPGQSGNPGGRSTEKIFADIFRAIANEIDPKTRRRKAQLLGEKIYDLALAGEAWAAQVVLDRTDGKAAIEATVTMKTQEVQALSDDELLALIARQQASKTSKQDEKAGSQRLLQ